MTERSTSSTKLRAIGRPGTVHSGGRLRHDDVERVWRGHDRDETIVRMQHDPVIGAILHGVEMLVRGVDWTVEAADDSAPAKEAAEFVGGCLEDMHGFWPGDTLSGMLSYIPWG